MARASRGLVAVLLSALVILLVGCEPTTQAQDNVAPAAAVAQAAVVEAVEPIATEAQTEVAEVVVPAVLAVRDDLQQLVAASAPTPAPDPWAGAEAAAKLIIRWEVGSPQAYTLRWEGVICPGGLSGPTIGIGYDLGHQTPTSIRATWADHAAVERLVTASGVVGDAACRAWRDQHRDIRVPFLQAEQVFLSDSLPAYRDAAAAALGEGWHRLPPNAQAADVSMGYNRGWSMRGERNREKRAIRDDCAPRGDAACNAGQLRAMKRLWPTVRGLRDRRDAEAALAEVAS